MLTANVLPKGAGGFMWAPPAASHTACLPPHLFVASSSRCPMPPRETPALSELTPTPALLELTPTPALLELAPTPALLELAPTVRLNRRF
jgi:hypothetical protein